MYGAMQLQHLPASCHLMKPVNILGNNNLYLPLLLQLCKHSVGVIGYSLFINHPVFIKTVELLRILHIKAVADDCFRRVLILLTIQPVLAPKVRNFALSRNTSTSKENYILAFLNPLL